MKSADLIRERNDPYYAMTAAKEKASKDGHVWDELGQHERDAYVATEMTKRGYVRGKVRQPEWVKK